MKRRITTKGQLTEYLRGLQSRKDRKDQIRRIYYRDGRRCTICKKKLLLSQATRGHIKPLSLCISVIEAWSDTNLRLECGPCNNKKGARYIAPS